MKFEKLASPGGGHLLGTNDQFYDIFSRVVWGARTALEVVLLSVVLSVVIGVPLGLVSGFLGGWVDRVLVFVMDCIYTVPYLLLAIIFAFMLNDKIGSGIVAAALSLVAIYIPQYFRVVRNTTVSAREATYVEAARAIGAKPTTIMRKYLFGNVVQSVPVIGTLNAADAVGTLAGARLPGARHPAQRGVGVGLRPQSRARRRAGRGLVAGAVAGPGDRPADHGADPRRRGSQRDAQPGAAPAPAARGEVRHGPGQKVDAT